MAWKQSGQPTIQQQRGKWVARVEGLDTETGKRRPRQIGTFSSKRAAQRAATAFAASGGALAARDTVAGLVDRWVASRVDVGPKTRLQYEWAAGHIREGLGGVRVDQLERADVARWLDGLAASGRFSRRSIQIFRTVLRAALADAVDAGELRRSPAARVGLPKQVAKPVRERDADAWTEAELDRFLTAIEPHRWFAPIRLCATYGLRRSEMLGLTWSAVDLDAGTIRIDRALVEVHGRPEWTEGKNERSRRTIPIDATTVNLLVAHRRLQLEERLAAGHAWHDDDLVVTTRTGTRVSPGNFDQTLDRLVAKAGVPRLTSHGLRHTAATHMVKHAVGMGEIRAIADILGHSPDELMRTYAHALPESVRTVTDKIERRTRSTAS